MREDSWLDVWKEDSSTLVRSRAVSSPGGMCWRRKDTRRNKRGGSLLSSGQSRIWGEKSQMCTTT